MGTKRHALHGTGLDRFRAVWVLDFKLRRREGEAPEPVCLVARELRSRREVRLWDDELRSRSSPPYDIGSDSAVFAHDATKAMGCHLALGWTLPTNVIDSFVEFRAHTNGLEAPSENRLLGALAHFGLESMSVAKDTDIEALVLRGAPYSSDERRAVVEYCAAQVQGIERLIRRLMPHVSVAHALLRGRYMCAAADMERRGVPIDAPLLRRMVRNWVPVQRRLVAAVDPAFGVFERGSFSEARFDSWLRANGCRWPRHSNGRLVLDDETWRAMARGRPELQPLYELRATLGQMRLADIAVGADGRNRVRLRPFRARTGRNAPSSARFVFGPARWMRGLIKPGPGMAIAYIDWSQQELGIAAALSKDDKMLEAYCSGDPYLRFAQQARAAPPHATKESHEAVREQFKACCLGVNYSMGEESLATMAGISVYEARHLLELHRRTYPRYWAWSDAVVNHAIANRGIRTVFGWPLHVGREPNERALRNFPMQANGAEMMRLACCFALERGLPVCAPIHDAFLVEAPVADIDDVVVAVQKAMEDASAAVLGGFRLRSEAKMIRYPERYMDKRGATMWNTVMRLLTEVERDGGGPNPSAHAAGPVHQ